MLKCKFHALLYEIKCYERGLQAKQLVHPVLKSGHSNAVEASHNVLIRLRSKTIPLEMTYYHVLANLGLIQFDMTHLTQKCGNEYHSHIFGSNRIPELIHHMRLPVLVFRKH